MPHDGKASEYFRVGLGKFNPQETRSDSNKRIGRIERSQQLIGWLSFYTGFFHPAQPNPDVELQQTVNRRVRGVS
jgi:hypothetical protein